MISIEKKVMENCIKSIKQLIVIDIEKFVIWSISLILYSLLTECLNSITNTGLKSCT